MAVRKSQIFIFTISLCLAVSPVLGIAGTGQSDRSSSQIELRLTPKTKIVRVGDELEVRAEIWNVGTNDLFIERNIYTRCAHSPLQLSLEGRTPIKDDGPGQGCAADCLDDPKQSFADRLTQQWILLPAGNFYGTTIRMNSDSFPQLRTPGKWILQGTYTSDGNLSASFCMNEISLDPQEVKKLSFRAWEGQSKVGASITVVRR
jgi:hypothetical protein